MLTTRPPRPLDGACKCITGSGTLCIQRNKIRKATAQSNFKIRNTITVLNFLTGWFSQWCRPKSDCSEQSDLGIQCLLRIHTTPAQPSQFDFLSKLLLVIVSRSNRFYRKMTPLVKMTLSHKAQCILRCFLSYSNNYCTKHARFYLFRIVCCCFASM